MVKVQADFPVDNNGQIDFEVWADALTSQRHYLHKDRLVEVCGQLNYAGERDLILSLQLAQLVGELHMDQDAVLAALVYRQLRLRTRSEYEVAQIVGESALDIAKGVLSMANTSLLELSSSPLQETEQQDQVENIKHMLATLIDDVRVAVLKLAERVVALRSAKGYVESRRQEIAREAQYIFAPLAGRLGIWQLKWELEDLSLRYLEPEIYQGLARKLKSKRGERERQVEAVADQVRALLRSYGVDGQVFGRAKHIYSIWRKMNSKSVPMEQVYDVRAVRVVVDSLSECYASLGVIHNAWSHIPAEFDDYIASPKENGYRSIHTAVIAPDGSTLEVQIRTSEMHRDAELGVCAHWSYKDSEADPLSGGHQDYRHKMDWLRQVMEWHEELAGTERLSTLLQHRVSQSRIFVSTPKGHVLELPDGATVLDFAYRVHTDVGHSCRSAMVDGRPVSLQTPLITGQQVQIETQSEKIPNRDWLELDLGFAVTDRARAKLVNYFRQLPESQAQRLGERVFIGRLNALHDITATGHALDQLVHVFDVESREVLFQRMGRGEISVCDALVTVLAHQDTQARLALPGVGEDFPKAVGICVEGTNRDGLLLDITRLVSECGLALTQTNGRVSVPDDRAIISIETAVTDWHQAVRLLAYLEHIPGVTEVTREPIGAS
ncbi:MAG: HD domain-containing protein [Pseudomonadota bacterium]